MIDQSSLLQHSELSPDTGCRLWSKGKTVRGYGKVKTDGKDWLVHRLLFTLVYGPIPDGMLVCHSCDTPSCVELTHLFLGSPKDNTRDMLTKDRGARLFGESNGRCKLTEDQVVSILNDHRSQTAIAEEYKVHLTTVNKIKTGNRWQHLSRV